MNNFQLRDALLRSGFLDITSEDRSTKSWRLHHPRMTHYVSLKLANEPRKPMATLPLIVHPDDARSIEQTEPRLSGVTVDPTPVNRDSTKYSGIAGRAVAVTDERALDAMLARLIPGLPGAAAARLASRSTTDYANALLAISASMTAAQKAMLIAHALASAHELSMDAIAQAVEADGYQASNLHYGDLGRKLAEQLGIDGLEQQTLILGQDTGTRDPQGHTVWRLREPVVEALREIGWIDDPHADELALAAAGAAVDADPSTSNAPPTTRDALVKARIGQGEYRANLMRLWSGRCALTGCGVPEALIASHAKAWAESTNEERLNRYNGLLLSASVDRLFDRGLISFDDDGRLLKKSGLSDDDLRLLGVVPQARLRKVDSRHRPYLAAHREANGFTD